MQDVFIFFVLSFASAQSFILQCNERNVIFLSLMNVRLCNVHTECHNVSCVVIIKRATWQTMSVVGLFNGQNTQQLQRLTNYVVLVRLYVISAQFLFFWQKRENYVLHKAFRFTGCYYCTTKPALYLLKGSKDP